jgi:hypothetical protein
LNYNGEASDHFKIAKVLGIVNVMLFLTKVESQVDMPKAFEEAKTYIEERIKSLKCTKLNDFINLPSYQGEVPYWPI